MSNVYCDHGAFVKVLDHCSNGWSKLTRTELNCNVSVRGQRLCGGNRTRKMDGNAPIVVNRRTPGWQSSPSRQQLWRQWMLRRLLLLLLQRRRLAPNSCHRSSWRQQLQYASLMEEHCGPSAVRSMRTKTTAAWRSIYPRVLVSVCLSRLRTDEGSTACFVEWGIKWAYIGRSDVTESVVTIRPPFCGYNTI